MGTFTMLLVEGSTETEIFRDFLGTFLESVISELQKLWGWYVFWKCLKFKLDLKNVAENWEKFFVSEIIASELVLLNSQY